MFTPKQFGELSVYQKEDIFSRAILAQEVAEAARVVFPHNPVQLLFFPATLQSGTEPGDIVREALVNSDVALIMTTFSMSHTDARVEACAKGTRLATMPGVLAEMFAEEGVLTADYSQVHRLAEQLVPEISNARSVEITSKNGTDIRFSLAGRGALVDGGMYREPGSWGNLPAGECFVAPLEGTANGVLVADPAWYPKLWKPTLTRPMELEFQKGRVVALKGGGAAEAWFLQLLGLDALEPNEQQRSRANLAEFAIGTNCNTKSRISNLEMEKTLGTIHLAIGDNAHIGGVVHSDFHRDFIVDYPTVRIDGQLLINKGVLKKTI